MAAYAALVTLSKAIHQILPYEQHYSFLCDTQKMQSLLDKVISLQGFLEHISGKSSDSIDELESRIRDVIHRLEDIVESILVYSLAVEYQNEVNSRLSIQEGRAKSRKPFFSGLVKKISRKFEAKASLDEILGWCLQHDFKQKAKYWFFPLTERVAAAFGNCIQQVDLLLEAASTMEMKINLEDKVVISGTSIVPRDTATTSLSRGPPDANDTMVGLKDDLHQILDQINRRQRALEVIPITGMGGIGKTTLARAVYDHHGKQGHFDLVLWATVSQQYNVEEILRCLLSVDAEKKEPNKTLIELVHQRLYSRRYLIILDDVWGEKVWDGVRNAFPNNNNCSRVILTTRLANVATYVTSSTCAHQMQLLSEEQSWDLLRETVYEHEIGCPSKFEYHIGRRISRNCKGLPLALVVTGGLLKLNNAEDHWEHVATSTTAEAAADDDSLLRIMSLSYKNLPPHLKACFLYFGMFPEDEEIPTKELVRLWCAEGFLKPRESKTMEEVAEECLEELVERNMVLAIKKSWYDGKIKTTSIHDVLRDLSLRQAHNEKFLYYHRGNDPIDNDTILRIIKDQPRRVSFPQFNLDSNISYNSPIRTFRTDQRSGMIPQFKLVRVLGKVEFSFFAPLRNSVRLNNLRYLHFYVGYRSKSVRLNNLRYLHLYKGDCNNESIIVPKSISKLRNLETIFVSGGPGWLILPVEIWEMPRLRHLLVSEHVNVKLPPFPEEDSSTECLSLQTLTCLLNFVDFSPRVIQKLQQNLKKLKILYETISDGDDGNKEFVLENLFNLHHLEHLTISRLNYNAPIVRDIGFPINLKKLSLRNTRLPWEKMTSIGDSLKHLQVLKLSHEAIYGEVWEPIEGGFSQLKYLKMEYLDELEEWRAESTHFPSLEKLVILYCRKLKEVPAEIGDIDTLQNLIVKRGNVDSRWGIYKSVGDSFEESVRRIEEEQQRVGNHSLQVIFLSEYQGLGDVHR